MGIIVGLLILLTVGVVVDRLLHAFQQMRVFDTGTAEVAIPTETVAVPDWVLPTLRTNATVMSHLPPARRVTPRSACR